jgi:hypothetical protein
MEDLTSHMVVILFCYRLYYANAHRIYKVAMSQSKFIFEVVRSFCVKPCMTSREE